MRDYAGDTENPEYYQSADVLQLWTIYDCG